MTKQLSFPVESLAQVGANSLVGNNTGSTADGRALSVAEVVAMLGIADGVDGQDGAGWISGSYNASTGVVTFSSSDGLGFSTGDLRGQDGADGEAASQAFADITGKPTTLAGYGITDAATSAQGAKADSAVQPATLASGTITAKIGDLDFNNLRGGPANVTDTTDGIRVTDGGAAPSSVEVSNAETSGTDWERFHVVSNTTEYQIGSAVGSAGGTNRPVQIGHWDAFGTFTDVLQVEADRVWLNGKTEGCTIRSYERGGSQRSPIVFGLPYNGGDVVDAIEFTRLQESGAPPAIRFPDANGRISGLAQLDISGNLTIGHQGYGLGRTGTTTRLAGFSGVIVTTSTLGSTLAPLTCSKLTVSTGCGLFGATPPTVQPTAIVDVPTAGASTVADNATAINSILAALRGMGAIAT